MWYYKYPSKAILNIGKTEVCSGCNIKYHGPVTCAT